jgi:hypothetical protein
LSTGRSCCCLHFFALKTEKEDTCSIPETRVLSSVLFCQIPKLMLVLALVTWPWHGPHIKLHVLYSCIIICLLCRCLAMTACTGATSPAFSRHVTVFKTANDTKKVCPYGPAVCCFLITCRLHRDVTVSLITFSIILRAEHFGIT